MSLKDDPAPHTVGMKNSSDHPRSASGDTTEVDCTIGIDEKISDGTSVENTKRIVVKQGNRPTECDSSSHTLSLDSEKTDGECTARQYKNDAEENLFIVIQDSTVNKSGDREIDHVNNDPISETVDESLASNSYIHGLMVTDEQNVLNDYTKATVLCEANDISILHDKANDQSNQDILFSNHSQQLQGESDCNQSTCIDDDMMVAQTNMIENSNLEANQETVLRNTVEHCAADTSVLKKVDKSNSLHSLETNETIMLNEILKDELYRSEHSKGIARSVMSLNDHDFTRGDSNVTFDRSPLSKSAENLTRQEPPSILNDANCSIETIEKLDKEKVLADYEAHKSKVPLSPNLPEAAPQVSIDRTQRKEIVSQDFGSMFKNMHGIFSSVSGSLKHAYNISQRMPAPNKPININKLLTTGSLKNTANGKLINDIFETEQTDGKSNGTAVPELNIPNSKEASPNRDKRNPEGASISGGDSNKNFSIAEEDKLESLERTLLAERLEVETLREKLRQQAEELIERERERKVAETNAEMLRKRLEASEREKDGAVVRYAVSESAVIGARDAAEGARRAERAARAECELLAGKLRSAHAEKQRICQIYDDKCHEVMNAEKETTRLKEELKESEGKLRWAQSKLRTEIEAYKEAAAQAERLTQQVAELEAARDSAAANSEDSVRARQFESELKEARASLILARHESEELERRLTSSSQQLESCRQQLADTTAQLTLLQQQVEELKSSNAHLEEEAAELASLRARAALADTLTEQLERETERARLAAEECGRERARAETCARREAAALEHAARLTAEHVGERTQHRRSEAEARALGADNAGLRERLSALEVEATGLRARLADEAARRRRECQLLARKVAELTEELQASAKQLDYEKGENVVLKKKHASTVKELNRELQRTLKRCEQLEARAEPPARSTPTGSVSSLSGSESPGGGGGGGGGGSAPAAPPTVNGHARTDSTFDAQQPDRQALIERIVQLQRAGARRAERCDFLEEHNRQLTSELRDKARLLRQLLASQPAGALADNSADEHKREMARLGGGAMAAVWGGAADGMTLELSLEINRKLQAVLEDALLKNITLKNNMDTLGAEIARLKASKEST